MKLLTRHFHWPPKRPQAIWGVIVVAIVVGIAGFATSGVVAGLTLLLGFPGVLSLILLFLPNRPTVTANLRGIENAVVDAHFDGLLVGSEQTIRPFDVEQIVKNQEHAALETMPRAPTPQVPPGAFGGAFDLNSATSSMLSSVSGASDEELRAFVGEVQAYGKELRAWLEHLQAARRESLRAFTATVRVREAGQAPADFARVRLRFPEAFEEWEAPPDVAAPPERPKFVGRYSPVVPGPFRVQPIAAGALSRLIPRVEDFKGTSAEYSREDGSTIVALNIGHINQHDHRDTAEFVLMAAPPGLYSVEWQVSAEGLSPLTEGTLKVEVQEPQLDEPIVDLKDALAERKHHSLG